MEPKEAEKGKPAPWGDGAQLNIYLRIDYRATVGVKVEFGKRTWP